MTRAVEEPTLCSADMLSSFFIIRAVRVKIIADAGRPHRKPSER